MGKLDIPSTSPSYPVITLLTQCQGFSATINIFYAKVNSEPEIGSRCPCCLHLEIWTSTCPSCPAVISSCPGCGEEDRFIGFYGR